MLRTPRFLLPPLLGLALGAGPGAAQRPRDTPAPAQRTGPRTAQRPRDLSTPAKRLVGHWEDSRDSVHYYFGPTDTTTNTGILTQVAVRSGGRVTRFHYTIGPQVPARDQVDLQIVAFAGGSLGRLNILRVAGDGQTMTWTVVDGDIGMQHDLKYVDSRTAPR